MFRPRWRQADRPVDTRYYWNLTKHIIRYKHLHEADRYNGAHTVNEGQSLLHVLLKGILTPPLAVRAKGWIESIRFYTKFVLNWDEHM